MNRTFKEIIHFDCLVLHLISSEQIVTLGDRIKWIIGESHKKAYEIEMELKKIWQQFKSLRIISSQKVILKVG